MGYESYLVEDYLIILRMLWYKYERVKGVMQRKIVLLAYEFFLD